MIEESSYYSTQIHFDSIDFSQCGELLSTFISGEVITNNEKGKELCRILNTLDVDTDDIWNLSSFRSDWCLLGAHVKYCGPNRRTTNSAREYRYILVFTLDQFVTPSGRFVLKFNIPKPESDKK